MLFCTVASSRRNYQTPQLLGTTAQPAVSLFCASWRFWSMHRELLVERNPVIYMRLSAFLLQKPRSRNLLNVLWINLLCSTSVSCAIPEVCYTRGDALRSALPSCRNGATVWSNMILILNRLWKWGCFYAKSIPRAKSLLIISHLAIVAPSRWTWHKAVEQKACK